MSFSRFARLRPLAIERFLMLRGFILGVHVLLALMIIGLVLLQRGKGAEAGAGFGSGASGTVFGARGYQHLVLEIDRGVCCDVLCHQFDAGVSWRAPDRRADQCVGARSPGGHAAAGDASASRTESRSTSEVIG